MDVHTTVTRAAAGGSQDAKEETAIPTEAASSICLDSSCMFKRQRLEFLSEEQLSFH